MKWRKQLGDGASTAGPKKSDAVPSDDVCDRVTSPGWSARMLSESATSRPTHADLQPDDSRRSVRNSVISTTRPGR